MCVDNFVETKKSYMSLPEHIDYNLNRDYFLKNKK